MASSVSNKNSASALVSSVFPTPVGPRNRNEPLGRFGSESPARERRMALARTVASIVLALRSKHRLNVRQPLNRIVIVTGRAGVDEADLERVRKIILDEVNVKAVEYIQSSSGIVTRSAKPNFKTLGRRLGPLMKTAAARIRSLDHEAIEAYLQEGRLLLTLEEQEIELGPEDIEVTSEGIAGWLVEQEKGVTVALDSTLTPELIAEGWTREFVNRVQSQRKAADYTVTDRIRIELATSSGLETAIREQADWIRQETLATDLKVVAEPAGDLVRSYEIGEETVTIGLARA